MWAIRTVWNSGWNLVKYINLNNKIIHALGFFKPLSQIVWVSNYLILFTFFGITNLFEKWEIKKKRPFSFHYTHLTLEEIKGFIFGEKKLGVHNLKGGIHNSEGKKLLTEWNLYLNSLYYMAFSEYFDPWRKSHPSCSLSLLFHICISYSNSPITGWESVRMSLKLLKVPRLF